MRFGLWDVHVPDFTEGTVLTYPEGFNILQPGDWTGDGAVNMLDLNIVAGYWLDGDGINSFGSMAFTAPFGVAAMVDSNNQDWLNSVWNAVRAEIAKIQEQMNSFAPFDPGAGTKKRRLKARKAELEVRLEELTSKIRLRHPEAAAFIDV